MNSLLDRRPVRGRTLAVKKRLITTFEIFQWQMTFGSSRVGFGSGSGESSLLKTLRLHLRAREGHQKSSAMEAWLLCMTYSSGVPVAQTGR